MTAVIEAPAAPPRTGRRRRPGTDARIVSALLAIVLTVQAWNITGYPGLGDDEGTYLSQAWAVRSGLGLAPYTYWYDHPPAGWMQLALLSWLPDWLGGHPVTSYGRLIMLVVSTVNIMLLYALARRVGLARWSASAAVLLYGLSPLSVTMQRQIYLDSIAVAWFLAALLLALSARRHLWHHVAAGCCAAVAVLSKETMAMALPAIAVALWQGSHPTTRKFSVAGFVSALLMLCCLYPLYATLKGEFFSGPGHVSLLGAIQFQLSGRTGSGSVFTPGSDANRLLGAWLYSDGVLLFAGLAATVIAAGLACTHRFRPLLVPAVAGGMLTLVALRPGGYLPAMYVLQVLPFFALLTAGVLQAAVDGVLARRSAFRWVALGCCALAAAAFVLPRWYAGDRRALTTDANAPYAAAAEWIRHDVPDPAHTTVVLDDTLWLDAVEAGFRPGTGAIWFYKLDPDPAVSKVIRSWRDVRYLVSSPILRLSVARLPTASSVLAHSRVIETFGSGDNRVEIRQVVQ